MNETAPFLIDLLMRYRLDDYRREAERDRLAAQATRHQGRSLRQHMADGLYALAARVEGQQSRRATREGAPLAA